MTAMGEIISTITASVKRIRTYYHRAPYFKRLATITIAAFCMLVAAGVYTLSKNIADPAKDNTAEVTSEDRTEDKTNDTVPPRDSRDTPSSPLPSTNERKPDVPASRLDLTNWKIALPIDTNHAGSPDEIKQPEIASFSLPPYFVSNPNGAGVVFRAHAGGATTKNSKYPRSELREMTDGGHSEAGWSNQSGKHTMTVRQAVTHLPERKSEVVTAQIHDDSDDIVMVRLENRRLFVEADGSEIGVLNPEYVLGTPYVVTITAERNAIKVYYDGELKVSYDKDGTDYYFKVGCYTQSNTERGDKPDAYGEVIIYDLKVEHS